MKVLEPNQQRIIRLIVGRFLIECVCGILLKRKKVEGINDRGMKTKFDYEMRGLYLACYRQ